MHLLSLFLKKIVSEGSPTTFIFSRKFILTIVIKAYYVNVMVDTKPIYFNKHYLFQNKTYYLNKIYLCFLKINLSKFTSYTTSWKRYSKVPNKRGVIIIRGLKNCVKYNRRGRGGWNIRRGQKMVNRVPLRLNWPNRHLLHQKWQRRNPRKIDSIIFFFYEKI